jgi:hypothetical protein
MHLGLPPKPRSLPPLTFPSHRSRKLSRPTHQAIRQHSQGSEVFNYSLGPYRRKSSTRQRLTHMRVRPDIHHRMIVMTVRATILRGPFDLLVQLLTFDVTPNKKRMLERMFSTSPISPQTNIAHDTGTSSGPSTVLLVVWPLLRPVGISRLPVLGDNDTEAPRRQVLEPSVPRAPDKQRSAGRETNYQYYATFRSYSSGRR